MLEPTFTSINDMLTVIAMRKHELMELAPKHLNEDQRLGLAYSMLGYGTPERTVVLITCAVLLRELDVRRAKQGEKS